MGNLQLGQRACFSSFAYTNNSDGTAKTGLTVTADIKRINTDGSETTVATGVSCTESGNGVYRCSTTSTSVAGFYRAEFITSDSTVAARVLPSETHLIGLGGLENLDAAVSSRLASGSYTAPDNANIGAIKAKTDNLPGSPAAVGSAMTLQDGAITAAKVATGAIDADALATDAAQEIADTLLDRANGVEAGITPRQALRAVLAVLFGQMEDQGSGSYAFKRRDGSTVAVTVTVASGERTDSTIGTL